MKSRETKITRTCSGPDWHSHGTWLRHNPSLCQSPL